MTNPFILAPISTSQGILAPTGRGSLVPNNSRISELPSGDLVITFTTRGPINYFELPAENSQLVMQILGPDLTPRMQPVLVEPENLQYVSQGRVVPLPGEDAFAMFWSAQDNEYGALGDTISSRMAIYEADGTIRRGPETLREMVMTEDDQWLNMFDSLFLEDGRFLVAHGVYEVTAEGWLGLRNGTVEVLLYGPDSTQPPQALTPIGGAENLGALNISQDANGDIIAQWQEWNYTQGDITTYEQRYDAAGTQLSVDLISVEPIPAVEPPSPAVLTLTSGRYLEYWVEEVGTVTTPHRAGPDTDVMVQLFEADGQAVAPAFVVHGYVGTAQTLQGAIALPDGGFTILWGNDDIETQNGADPYTTRRIHLTNFNSDGEQLLGDFTISGTDGFTSAGATQLGFSSDVVVRSGVSGSYSWSDLSVSLWNSNTLDLLNSFQLYEGTAVADTLVGTQVDDLMLGHGSADILIGAGGNDHLNGGDGADNLQGGDGDDTLVGGLSMNDLRDLILGGDGNDIIDGGYGNDELRGDAGDDIMAGGFGADTVIGGTGDDVITGSALSDLLFGGDGMDFVNGGYGHDRVNGGNGADRFFHVGAHGHGSDWIQDYDAAEGDTLLFGIASADGDDFLVNFAHTASAAGERSGDDAVEEAFVIYIPTGQIMWALVDGAAQAEINIVIGGVTYDLLA